MNTWRLLSLILAVGMVPFALTTYNGATAAGILAAGIFIILTIAGATSHTARTESNEQEQ